MPNSFCLGLTGTYDTLSPDSLKTHIEKLEPSNILKWFVSKISTEECNPLETHTGTPFQ